MRDLILSTFVMKQPEYLVVAVAGELFSGKTHFVNLLITNSISHGHNVFLVTLENSKLVSSDNLVIVKNTGNVSSIIDEIELTVPNDFMVSLVVIEDIALDMCDVNDLKRLAQKYNFHIVVTTSTNYPNNFDGYIGTESSNKT